MNGKIITLVLLVMVATSVFVAPVAAQTGIDGNENGSGTSTPTETPDNTSQNESGDADISTQIVDVSPILTVNKVEWYNGNNTAVLTVTAEERHKVTKVWKRSSETLKRDWVTVPEGKSKIIIPTGGQDRIQIWSGSDGKTIKSPSLDLFDLPPSQWDITYRVFFGSIAATLVAVVVVYFREKHKIQNKVRSIFEMDWR